MTEAPAPIRIGIGGWDHDPWQETFFPADLPRSRRLEHVGATLAAVEVQATFYRLQKRETFEAWASAVPPDFRFAIKASRYSTNRRHLGEAAEAIGRFAGQGFTGLGDRLGPILWQLAPTKAFDASELSNFLSLLPTRRDGLQLRHAIEARHPSFRCREFVAMARAAGVAICFVESADGPAIPDLTADFVYVRLTNTRDEEPLGLGESELDAWAERLRTWARGESPVGLSYLGESRAPVAPREVFAFFISGAKHRNPAAAQALIRRLETGTKSP